MNRRVFYWSIWVRMAARCVWAAVGAALMVVLILAAVRVAAVDRHDIGSAVHNVATSTWNLSSASKSVDGAAQHVGALAERVDTASKPVLECVQTDADGKRHGNGGCLPAQILATVGSIKAMAGAGAKAAPKIVSAIEDGAGAAKASAENVRQLTGNLSDAGKKVGEQVTAVGAAAAGLRTDLKPTLEASQALVVNLDSRIGELMEPVKGTLVAVQGSAAAFQNFLPMLQTNIGDFTKKAAETADHIATITKPHWYDRMIGYGLSAAGFYRDLNPGYGAAQGIRGLVTKKKEQ